MQPRIVMSLAIIVLSGASHTQAETRGGYPTHTGLSPVLASFMSTFYLPENIKLPSVFMYVASDVVTFVRAFAVNATHDEEIEILDKHLSPLLKGVIDQSLSLDDPRDPDITFPGHSAQFIKWIKSEKLRVDDFGPCLNESEALAAFAVFPLDPKEKLIAAYKILTTLSSFRYVSGEAGNYTGN